MEEIRIPIDPTMSDYVQYLFYKTNAYKTIIEEVLLQKRDYNINEELFKKYNDEYQHYFTKLELYKMEVLQLFAKEYYGKENMNFRFDFLNYEVVVESNGGCTSCSK